MMATGFITFGVGVGTFAIAVRTVLQGPAWLALGATALATVLVAATPLDVSDGVDQLHAIFAAVGYVTLVIAALLAGAPLRRRGWARLATAGRWSAGVAVPALALSVVGPATGLFQRIGLTAVDLWLIALAALVATGRLARVHDHQPDRVPALHADAGPATAHPPHARAASDAVTRADPRTRPATSHSPTRPISTGAAATTHSAA
jgi:hypothetical protein